VEKPEPQTLPHTLAAPAQARRFLTSVSAAWSADVLDVAVLLTSELVTNAVVHGLGPVQLLLDDDGDRLRIEVSDAEPALPPVPSTPGPTKEHGRGLLIVDRLADRWGSRSRRTPPGKIVWFELRSGPVAAAI
jgi:anti-sigma regulatory factor (Ser/Thr protein kinase)